MAYSFGGGVRPELGRTDFTPFLQGSVRGAQMQARGAENFAKGIASAGDSLAQGVKTYFANKNIIADQMGKLEGVMAVYGEEVNQAIAENPEMQQIFKRALNNGTLNMKDATRGGAFADSFLKTKQAQIQEQSMREQQRVAAERLAMQQDAARQENNEANIISRVLVEEKNIADAISRAREAGVTNLNSLISQWGEIEKIKAATGERDIPTKPITVTLADDTEVHFVAAWTGSQWQFLRPPEGTGAPTAYMRDTERRLELLNLAQELYNKGKLQEAANMLNAANSNMAKYEAYTVEDVKYLFQSPEAEKDDKSTIELDQKRQPGLLSRIFGRGTGQNTSSQPVTSSDQGIPEGLSPELWNVMTPEEKAKWQ